MMGSPEPYYQHAGITIYHKDCREVLPQLGEIDLVLTDPPYPSYLTEEYKYSPDLILTLDLIKCRQFVFWTPAAPFPMDYSGKRIWDKGTGTHTQFEEIYERNNRGGFRMLRHYRHNNALNASWVGDFSFDHPSQKPIRLIRELAVECPEGGLILDPFMGSGTSLRAAKDIGRRAIGIEIEERYCEIAAERLRQEVLF